MRLEKEIREYYYFHRALGNVLLIMSVFIFMDIKKAMKKYIQQAVPKLKFTGKRRSIKPLNQELRSKIFI